MFYCLLIHCMVVILLIQVNFSKSADSNFEIEEQSEKNSKDFGSEDNVGIHVSYRPKHKYKFGTGRDSLKRFTEDDSRSDGEDDNPTQYAIMFKNSEPVGILQPYEDSYRFLPVSGESTNVELNPVPLKEKKSLLDIIKPRETNFETTEDKSDNKVGFIDERYPALLAKFKIDSRVAAYRHNMIKRATESTDITDSQLSSLKSTMAKVRSEDNVLVEEELKSILDDMGLIDDYPNREEKREVVENDKEEDENLEFGTNKINLLKENPKDFREKREFVDKVKEESTTKNNLADKAGISEATQTMEVSDGAPIKERSCTEKTTAFQEDHEKPIKERSCPDKTVGVQEELQEPLKEGRENIIEDIGVSQDEIPIERSTLNIANEEVQEYVRERRENIVNDAEVSENDVPIEKSTPSITNEEVDPYEKRIERDIRDKILRLKEEVKKEMEELSNTKRNVDETRRKKRQIMTNLLDAETKDIDPLNNDIENNKVHIRRKRDLSNEQAFLPVLRNTMNEGIYGTSETKIPIPINRRRKRNVNDEDYFKDDNEEFATDRSIESTKIAKGHVGNMVSEDMDDSDSDILDQSNFIFQPLLFDKRTCECKNGNCKCGKSKGNEHLETNSNQQIISDSDFNLSDSQNENLNEAEDEEEDVKLLENESINNHKLRAPRKIKEGFHFTDGEYFIDQHPALFQLTPVEEVEGNDHLITVKGKSNSGNHLYALKRSMIPHSRFRRRTQTENNEPIQLIDMSAEELFGALPQSYEGELTRYKRVKRSKLKN